MWAVQLLRSYGTKVVATATVKGVKGKRLIPTRAALTLVSYFIFGVIFSLSSRIGI